MKRIKYNNAIINITGNPDRKKLEEATIRFIRKARLKGKRQNDNKNASRTISKK